jgi:hypothetical protein
VARFTPAWGSATSDNMLSRLRDARAHASKPLLIGEFIVVATAGLLDGANGEAADEAVEEYVVEQSDRQTGDEARGHQQPHSVFWLIISWR